MNWFMHVFEEQSIAWLLIVTVVSFVSGFVSSLLTYRFVKRPELLETMKMEIEKQKKERIRQEVVRWSNPIKASLIQLISQLNNILYDRGYIAMKHNYREDDNPNWSISYDYFMNSLSFLFGQYFAWIQMFQEELNFELFQTQDEKDRFSIAIHKVRSALSKFPPNYDCEGKDLQVFALQQRAIGELLIIRDSEGRRCMSYPEFLANMKNQQFKDHLQPILKFLDGVNPKDSCRWKRLEATKDALMELEIVCNDLLEIPSKNKATACS